MKQFVILILIFQAVRPFHRDVEADSALLIHLFQICLSKDLFDQNLTNFLTDIIKKLLFFKYSRARRNGNSEAAVETPGNRKKRG